jgi:hypothetical protein
MVCIRFDGSCPNRKAVRCGRDGKSFERAIIPVRPEPCHPGPAGLRARNISSYLEFLDGTSLELVRSGAGDAKLAEHVLVL